MASAPGPMILTPHPGEAGRLLGKRSDEVEKNRAAAVRELAARTKAVVVLKGARTVLAGLARSQPARGGRATCVLDQGAKPIDSTAPALFVTPADDNWHHAPALVTLFAQDGAAVLAQHGYSADEIAALQRDDVLPTKRRR